MSNLNREKKHLLFTFDYELFLGSKSGNAELCLIIPTNKILSILAKYNAKAIFFIDTTYLIQLNSIRSKYEAANTDWHNITEQIKLIFESGHDVFPHLHPHWLDAVYRPDTNEWDLSESSKYRFNSISETERAYIWESSINILQSVIHPLDASYLFDGYRAGGWCIQPFEDFRPFFEKYAIQYEFSVRPGYKQLTTAHQYDFVNAPSKSIYNFEADLLTEDADGRYQEFTISSIKKITGVYNFLNRLLYKTIFRKGNKGFGNGTTVYAEPIDANAACWKNNADMEMVSIENMTAAKLQAYKSFISNANYMQFLSHPKLINNHHLTCLNLFLKTAIKKYPINTDFRKVGLLK
jgi:hypothetical protein